MLRNKKKQCDIYFTSFRSKPIPDDAPIAKKTSMIKVNHDNPKFIITLNRLIKKELMDKGYNEIETPLGIEYSKTFSGVITQNIALTLSNGKLSWQYTWIIETDNFTTMFNGLKSIRRDIRYELFQIEKSRQCNPEESNERFRKSVVAIKKQHEQWVAKYGEFRNEIWGRPNNIAGRMFLFEACRNKRDLSLALEFIEVYLQAFGYLGDTPEKERSVRSAELVRLYIKYKLYLAIIKRACAILNHRVGKDDEYLKKVENLVGEDTYYKMTRAARNRKGLAIEVTLKDHKSPSMKYFKELMKKDNIQIGIMQYIDGVLHKHGNPFDLIQDEQAIAQIAANAPMPLHRDKIDPKDNREIRKQHFFRCLYLADI